MFKFFHRSATVARSASASSNSAGSPWRSRDLSEPIPLPEVVEGDSDADWELWQDSVNLMDSQFQPMSAIEETAAQGLDVFGKVGRRDQ